MIVNIDSYQARNHGVRRYVGWLTLMLVVGMSSFSAATTPRSTMYVEGTQLFDRCGEQVVLRGFNAMIVFWDRLGTETYPEMAKTGANCCRIFWKTDAASAEELDQTLANCRAHKMVPIPCVWDATGKWENLQQCVDFWCRPEIVQVLRKHEGCLIVNIANEAGNRDVSQQAFRDGYARAIKQLRAAGLRMPLMVDAAHWGRGEEYILENGVYLLQQDPLRNILFSWHPWDPQQPASRYRAAIDGSLEKNLCLVIGEFSHVGVFFKEPIDYEFILEYCHQRNIGWLPWVWWCCDKRKHDGHSVTTNRKYGHWANAPWGERVAVSSPFSIKNTAKRSRYLETGECSGDD
jgi:mannan endo-1,4-beta-mannosidase